MFKFSKIEVDSFNYCGCRIKRLECGSIVMDHHEYVDSLELIEEKKDELDRKLTAYEQKVLRGKIGEVLWISLLTRPDLAFDVN